MIRTIFVFVVSMVGVYLITAFVVLHLDFRLWKPLIRILYILIGGMISTVITTFEASPKRKMFLKSFIEGLLNL